MSQSVANEKVASVPVKPGLFALRYLDSGALTPPRIFVQVSPASVDDVDLIFSPGDPKGFLGAPEDIAVVVAERSGNLQLTVMPFAGGGSDARVTLEPLKAAIAAGKSSEDAANRKKARAAAAPSDGSAAGSGEVGGGADLEVMCHVSRRGDVIGPQGEWIGGPEEPAVIEGVVLTCGDLGSQQLEYQVLLPGSGGVWSPWVRSGGFAGTRGRALGLIGLRVRLSGPDDIGGLLRGDAVFLGSPVISESGRELEFASYAGADPMVGLRLTLEPPRASALVGDLSGQRRSDSPSSGRKRAAAAPNGLRVFKSNRALKEVG